MIVCAIGMRPPPPTPCRPTADDQNPHGRCERARERPENENADGQQHDGAPAVNIGKLAEQRRRRRRGQKIRRDDPRQVVNIFQAPADRGQCRRDDCLLERGDEHRHHDTGDDGVNGGMIERRQSRSVLRPACEGCRCERRTPRIFRRRRYGRVGDDIGSDTVSVFGPDLARHISAVLAGNSAIKTVLQFN